MESPILKAGVAAAQAALGTSPAKKEETPDDKSKAEAKMKTEVVTTEFHLNFNTFSICSFKVRMFFCSHLWWIFAMSPNSLRWLWGKLLIQLRGRAKLKIQQPKKGRQNGRQLWRRCQETPALSRLGTSKTCSKCVQSSWLMCWRIPGQDILAYLSLYVEPTAAGGSLSTAHPVDLVLDAFKDPEVSKITMNKLKVFLEEAMKVNSRKMECASSPEAQKNMHQHLQCMFHNCFLGISLIVSCFSLLDCFLLPKFAIWSVFAFSFWGCFWTCCTRKCWTPSCPSSSELHSNFATDWHAMHRRLDHMQPQLPFFW